MPETFTKKLDAQGGELPVVGKASLQKADFVTYPEGVKGSNCGNCRHQEGGVCQYEGDGISLKGQPVTPRNCCGKWDAPNTLRTWEKEGKSLSGWAAFDDEDYDTKALSAYMEGSGGALVAPARQGEKDPAGHKSHAVESRLREACEGFVELGTSPDYQRLYWNPETRGVWWESADGDDGGVVDEIVRRLREVPGVGEVRAEAEVGPKGEGWVRLYDRNRKKSLPAVKKSFLGNSIPRPVVLQTKAFTGVKKDRLGRLMCYEGGVHIPCPEPHTPEDPEKNEDRPKDDGRGGGKHPRHRYPKARAAWDKMVPAKRKGGRVVLLETGREAPPHITAAMVPEGWADVKVSLVAEADLMVKARDAKGRAKFVYSNNFRMRAAAVKFARVDEMVRKGGLIDAQIQKARADPARKEEADCAWLMAVQGTRPGSDRDTKAEVRAYGATTLEGRHVAETPEGVRLKFVGKEGVPHDHLIKDKELAAMLLGRKKKAGEKGRLFNTNENKVNILVRSLDGGHFTCKDLRTRRANVLAAALVKKRPDLPANQKEYRERVKYVAGRVAELLGNTPKMALEAYINPAVFSVWRLEE